MSAAHLIAYAGLGWLLIAAICAVFLAKQGCNIS